MYSLIFFIKILGLSVERNSDTLRRRALTGRTAGPGAWTWRSPLGAWDRSAKRRAPAQSPQPGPGSPCRWAREWWRNTCSPPGQAPLWGPLQREAVSKRRGGEGKAWGGGGRGMGRQWGRGVGRGGGRGVGSQWGRGVGRGEVEGGKGMGKWALIFQISMQSTGGCKVQYTL